MTVLIALFLAREGVEAARADHAGSKPLRPAGTRGHSGARIARPRKYRFRVPGLAQHSCPVDENDAPHTVQTYTCIRKN